MIQLEKQCYYIQNVMHGHIDPKTFDRVSDTDDDTSTLSRHQCNRNTPDSDTNTIDNQISSETQDTDQLTTKTPSDCTQYTTWSLADNIHNGNWYPDTLYAQSDS